eukprot:scaffold7.g3691.t1
MRLHQRHQLLPDSLYLGASDRNEAARSGALALISVSALSPAAYQAPAPVLAHGSAFSRAMLQAGGPAPPPAAPAHPLPAHPRLPVRSLIPAVAYQPSEQQSLSDALRKAGKKALGGGIPGAAAMAIQAAVRRRLAAQVLSLMWLRTTVNYQYRYGGTLTDALRTLYKEGGVVRFYRGLGPALLQGLLSRFGDTAANTGMLALLDGHDSTKNLPVAVKTVAASASAGAFRIFLMPVDAAKTIMQARAPCGCVASAVEGATGFSKLVTKVRVGGPTVLYHGALAASAATFVGHYPWFATYNYLNHTLPQYDDLPRKLLRSAFIGFVASAISDTCSNSIRVVKTTKQTATTPMTYPQAVRTVVDKDGVLGLFGRGLKTKIISNGLQGLMFSVLWRLGQDWWNKEHTAKS